MTQPTVDALIASLSKDPNWNGGRCYANGGIDRTMVEMRIAPLNGYGIRQERADLKFIMP